MPRLRLPSVYPITDTRVSGLTHLEQVRRLIDGGATLIQLREKRASPREFYSEALGAIEYAHARGVTVIINDRADIALATGADGVHLGQDDMPPAAAREILGLDAIVGYSTHSVEQAVEAAGQFIDYIAIGPVFNTQTKENPDPNVGFEGLAAVQSAVPNLPIVAIGGIDRSNLRAVLTSGADSAAIIGGLFTHTSGISDAMQELLMAATDS
ncbi:MAG TPA: thiamine phosphate synthase [Pyrinomonadaceae bacterium]|jgi:thiamine-phosphate pyrophosphorylase|nr:thiamine phosphate synthase [Pyrinomonadaceae bacterium]